jgi:hypothetical protein
MHQETLALHIERAVDTVGTVLNIKGFGFGITNFGQERAWRNRRGLRGPPREEMVKVY